MVEHWFEEPSAVSSILTISTKNKKDKMLTLQILYVLGVFITIYGITDALSKDVNKHDAPSWFWFIWVLAISLLWFILLPVFMLITED